jgi:endonuclease-8
MPEGPSIVIMKEAVAAFSKKKIIAATGTTEKADLKRITGKTVREFRSWGKHFLICLDKDYTIRIHLLLFGTYRINERKETAPRLSLQFDDGEINFYTCSIQEITQPLDEVYDWTADVMNEKWDDQQALEKLAEKPDMLVCDALLNQDIFAGVGNIIKNEVLYRIRVHPATQVGDLPKPKLKELVREAVNYSYDFLEWKKDFTLKKHWLAHTKKVCLRCDLPIHKEYMGKTNRRTFYCDNCQKLYA